MSDPVKQLFNQLVNKVEEVQNEAEEDSDPLIVMPNLLDKYRNQNENNLLFDELQNCILKKALNELTLKSICEPHNFLTNEEEREKENEAPKDQKDERTERRSKKELLLNKKEDIKNLLYSHFPKYLNTGFRFKIGELVYLKWHDELCVVMINYASQKLLVSSDNEFDDNYENNDEKNPQIQKRTVWLYDINEDIYLDSDNHFLYSKTNQIRPINLVLNRYDYKFNNNYSPNGNGGSASKDKNILKYYFVPIYYVTFPGYKKRCSRVFRFWVQEKDLIKFKSIRFIGGLRDRGDDDDKEIRLKRSREDKKKTKKDKIDSKKVRKELYRERRSKREYEVNIVINKVRGDKAWNRRTISPVNEYVYDVLHNIYNVDFLTGKYISNSEFFCNSMPWIVPKRVKKVIIKDHKLVLARKVNIKNRAKSRRSISTVVQNFKYLLLLISRLISPANPNYADEEGEGADRVTSSPKTVPVVQLNVESLSFLSSLQSFKNCNSFNYTKFNEFYLSNFYWLDLLLVWIDHHFLSSCCFSRYEYVQISSIKRLYNRPLSSLLGFEYLCRVLSFDTFYLKFLSKIERNNKPFSPYIPIIQLLLYYLAFMADEYTNSTVYGIKSV